MSNDSFWIPFLGFLCSILTCSCQSFEGMDILVPYKNWHRLKHRQNRDIRECQHIKYGNVTYSKHAVHRSGDLTAVDVRYAAVNIGEYHNKRSVLFHFQVVSNPQKTFSVLEPYAEGSCQQGKAKRSTVADSAVRGNCVIAANAGFFNTRTGECIGNVISNGRLVQDSQGIQNAHFGITQDGYIYVGYLSEVDLVAQNFVQLVGGVIWLVRDGEIFIGASQKFECPDAEETGTLERFINVRSARSAVGHDKDGRVLMIQIDGQTDQRGVNLWEMAQILLNLGFVNAINLDGGGSLTTVINQTLVNYPSDDCPDDKRFKCARKVSTILCIHEPYCDPRDCSGHGICVQGNCKCEGRWSGLKCDILSCPGDCSGKGVCSEGGCVCDTGWAGRNCSERCPPGRYGDNCSSVCQCQHGGQCHHVNGVCSCPVGFTGEWCELACPFGFYGLKCEKACTCKESCFCDHVTGVCNGSWKDLNSDLQNLGTCVAQRIIQVQHLVPDQNDQYRLCLTSVVTLSIVAAISLILNMSLLCMYHNAHRRSRLVNTEGSKKTTNKLVFHETSSSVDEESECDSGDPSEVTTLFPAKGAGRR